MRGATAVVAGILDTADALTTIEVAGVDSPAT